MRQQRQTKEDWKNTVAAQQASGLKDSEYCAKHNIHIQTFYARRSENNKKTTQTISKLVKVIQSTPPLISTTAPLTIIHHGLTLSVTQPVEVKWLTDVIKAPCVRIVVVS
jgi:hypothetical protein